MSNALIEEKTLDPAKYEFYLEKGISKKTYKEIAKDVSTVKKISELAGVSPRSLARLKDDDLIPHHSASIILSTVRILVKATEIFGSRDKANDWINRVNKSLGNRVPLDMMENRFGAEEVMNTLLKIEYGTYS